MIFTTQICRSHDLYHTDRWSVLHTQQVNYLTVSAAYSCVYRHSKSCHATGLSRAPSV